MALILPRIHRYIGLTMLGLWFVQALTGVVMVFHWEVGDALVPSAHRAADWPALERRIRELETDRPGWHASSVYPTGGAADRFDIFLDAADDRTDVVRVDGAGTVLSERPSERDYLHAPLLESAVTLHQSLFAGHRGRLFLGVSGSVLLINLLFGVKLAWPARGDWRRSLLKFRGWPRAWRLRAWHRTAGLWLVIPAFVFLSAGVFLAFDDALEELLHAAPEIPAIERSAVPAAIGPGGAIERALARFPDSTFSGLAMPADGRPWYRVRVRQPGEIRRVFGTTAVYISPLDGRTLGVNDATRVSWRRRFLDATYPVHTGEVAGLPGRLLALASGLMVLTSLLLGAAMWWRRRAPTTPRPAAG
jgi:uncharacterized iron-regulated membrane protein